MPVIVDWWNTTLIPSSNRNMPQMSIRSRPGGGKNTLPLMGRMFFSRTAINGCHHGWQGLSIELNTIISSITYDADNGVALVTRDGRTFEADAALITVPIGV